MKLTAKNHRSEKAPRFASFFAPITLPTVLMALALIGCSSSGGPTLKSVEAVDLSSYLGTWKELYRIPNSFQDGEDPCYETTATYRRRKDGKIVVRNECKRSHGPDEAVGLARVVEGSGGSRLKVNFAGIWLLRALGIGDGNYYIMALGPLQNNRYQWALVGEPGRQYGWILARQDLPKKTLEEIFEIAESRGYKREQFQSYPGSTKAGE